MCHMGDVLELYISFHLCIYISYVYICRCIIIPTSSFSFCFFLGVVLLICIRIRSYMSLVSRFNIVPVKKIFFKFSHENAIFLRNGLELL